MIVEGLTAKEIVELRIKCLEPFVAIASKHQIEQDVVLKRAEQAWAYATAPLTQNKKATTETGGDDRLNRPLNGSVSAKTA